MQRQHVSHCLSETNGTHGLRDASTDIHGCSVPRENIRMLPRRAAVRIFEQATIAALIWMRAFLPASEICEMDDQASWHVVPDKSLQLARILVSIAEFVGLLIDGHAESKAIGDRPRGSSRAEWQNGVVPVVKRQFRIGYVVCLQFSGDGAKSKILRRSEV